jgi:hypothetical protein
MLERVVAVIVGFGLAACAKPQEPAKNPAAGPSPGAVAPPSLASSVEPAASADSPASSEPTPVPATPEPTETKPAAPSIHDVCFAMCDQIKGKCPKNAYDSCRVNCGKYESHAEGCADTVRAALSCARDAADLVCANVAPESCAKAFRQITACNNGQKPVAAAEPTAAALPQGFKLYENRAEGVHAPMPDGVVAGEKDVIASAKYEGAVYSIRKLPRPEGKLNEKIFLKIAMNLFGRCSDKMKMQGMVDKPGRTSINYSTKCPDGSEEHGLFWATDKVLFLASAKGQPGKLGPTEAFLYGFEAK